MPGVIHPPVPGTDQGGRVVCSRQLPASTWSRVFIGRTCEARWVRFVFFFRPPWACVVASQLGLTQACEHVGGHLTQVREQVGGTCVRILCGGTAGRGLRPGGLKRGFSWSDPRACVPVVRRGSTLTMLSKTICPDSTPIRLPDANYYLGDHIA